MRLALIFPEKEMKKRMRDGILFAQLHALYVSLPLFLSPSLSLSLSVCYAGDKITFFIPLSTLVIKLHSFIPQILSWQ